MTAFDAAAVAKALRAAADALQPEPAGPRTGAAIDDLTRGFLSMSDLSRLRTEVIALQADRDRWQAVAKGLRARSSPAQGDPQGGSGRAGTKEGSEPSTDATDAPANVSPGGEAVLAVVEAARAWRAGIRLTVDEAGPNSAVLMRAVDALDAPLDTGRAPITYWGILQVAEEGARRGGWLAGVRWAAAEADAQSAWRDPVYILDVTDHLRACADNPNRKTVIKRDQAPLIAQVDDQRPADGTRPRAGYTCHVRPAEDGGVWGSYVEYLNHLEHVAMAAREWRSFRNWPNQHGKPETQDLIRAVDSLDHPEGT